MLNKTARKLEGITGTAGCFPENLWRISRRWSQSVCFRTNKIVKRGRSRNKYIDVLIIIRGDSTVIILEFKYDNIVGRRKFSLYEPLKKIFLNNSYHNIFNTVGHKVKNKIYVGVLV